MDGVGVYYGVLIIYWGEGEGEGYRGGHLGFGGEGIFCIELWRGWGVTYFVLSQMTFFHIEKASKGFSKEYVINIG